MYKMLKMSITACNKHQYHKELILGITVSAKYSIILFEQLVIMIIINQAFQLE